MIADLLKISRICTQVKSTAPSVVLLTFDLTQEEVKKRILIYYSVTLRASFTIGVGMTSLQKWRSPVSPNLI